MGRARIAAPNSYLILSIGLTRHLRFVKGGSAGPMHAARSTQHAVRQGSALHEAGLSGQGTQCMAVAEQLHIRRPADPAKRS
jgi:hypothetical protein